MQRIGLTGGIASGKSTASARFAALGAVVIDHDSLARAAVASGTIGLDEVVEAFGPDVLAPDGSLDRPALGAIVFSDPEALARLNAIVHPEIRRLSAEHEAAAAARIPGAVIIHDVPLLVETGQVEDFHVVVVVHAPAELRVQRLVDLRGATVDEARRRVAAQAADEERLAAADVVLDGSGSVEHLCAQVDSVWDRLGQERAAEIAAGLG
jgi:dephospho-CoA kinase